MPRGHIQPFMPASVTKASYTFSRGARMKRVQAAAVKIALSEMARRHRMKELFSAGLGMTPEELRDGLDPASYAAPAETVAPTAEPPPPHDATRHPAG